MFLKWFFCFSALFTISIVHSKESNIRIGTFNIEWLGDGNNDTIVRSSKDYIAIAHIISTIDCDILALQEIENEEALRSILKIIGKQYDYFIDTTSENLLKVAFIYKNTFKKIDAQFIHFSKTSVKFERPALYLKLMKNNREFEFISVHLKSSFGGKRAKEDSKSVRIQQVEELTNWMKKHKKKHSILLGDFNEEYENGVILKSLEKTFNSSVISKKLISCANRKWKLIDHIILPEQLKTTFKPERVQIFNHRILSYPKSAPKISDHCLVYYTLS